MGVWGGGEEGTEGEEQRGAGGLVICLVDVLRVLTCSTQWGY